MEITNSNGAIPAQDPAGEVVASIAEAQKISADEIALYDRQIRLWGVQAQEKIRTANILLISIRALATEVAKNLVLAGIGSLTIVDDEVVTEDDLGAQFFISDADVGKNRAEAALPQIKNLNPRVQVTAVTTPILNLPPEFYNPFTLVIASDLPWATLSTVSAAARLAGKPSYLAGSHGFYGFIFADLIEHKYIIEREVGNRTTVVGPETITRSIFNVTKKKENGKNVELVGKREIYSPFLLANTSPLPKEVLANRRRLKAVPPLLSCLRGLWEFEKLYIRTPLSANTDQDDLKAFTNLASNAHKELQLPAETLNGDFLKSFLQNLGAELAPVTAFLGGQLAQDVINVLGGREQPIQNFLLFDGDESKGLVYALHPIFQDGLDGMQPVSASNGFQIPAGVEAVVL